MPRPGRGNRAPAWTREPGPSGVDEELITEALDAAVVAALPVVFEVLDRELTPRLEALPLKARLTLARARRRRDGGLD